MSEKIPYEQVMRRMRMDIDYIAEGAYQKGLSRGYKDGYEAGQHEATTLEYQCGLNDAWSAAKKLFSEASDTEINLIFPQEWNNGGFKALMTLHPQDAIDRIKAYEEQQKADDEIKVGDEVMSNNAISDHTGVVLALSPGKNSAKVLENDGSMAWVDVNVLIKTGRHFNFLTPLLNEMKEGAE